jgi:hypothetical protein
MAVTLLAAGIAFWPFEGPLENWWAPLAVVTPALALMGWPMLDRRPRIVVTPEGLKWRKGHDSALWFLAWSEILIAETGPGDEDGPPLLRLTLAPRPALEVVASGSGGRHVEIPLDDLDLPVRRLKVAIHRAAPHLFTRVSRKA